MKFRTQIKFTWFSFFLPCFCGKNWCLLLTVFATRFKKCFRSRQAWDGVNCLFLFKHFFESLFSFASIFLNFNVFLGNLSRKNLTFLLTMVLLERNQWLIQKIVSNIPTYDECHCGKLLQFFQKPDLENVSCLRKNSGNLTLGITGKKPISLASLISNENNNCQWIYQIYIWNFWICGKKQYCFVVSHSVYATKKNIKFQHFRFWLYWVKFGCFMGDLMSHCIICFKAKWRKHFFCCLSSNW